MSELEIWNELGNIYFKNEAYDEAIRTYQKAIEVDHGCGQSYSNLAFMYIHQGRYADAIPMLQKGIELLEQPASQAVLWNQMGESYRKLDEFAHATACYRKAADLDPENIAYQDNLSEAELDGGQLDPQSIAEAEAPQTEAASWVFKNQGLVYPAEEDPSEAPEVQPVTLGSRLLSDAPGQGDTGRIAPNPAEVYLPAGRPVGKAPTNARADGLLRLGLKHWRQKEYERAIQFLETALSTVDRPKDNLLEALCYNAIALVETDLGKIVEAIQAYQSAASLAPEHIFPWNSLGSLNCMLDRYDDALVAFRESIEHNPKDPVSWNGMGDVYHKLGRFEDAITAYQLGNVFEKQALDEDPLKAYERSIEASRKNPEVWNEAGNIYFHTSAYEDAIASYLKAIHLDPSNMTSQANLAKAKHALEQTRNKDEGARPEIAPGNLLHSESTPAKALSSEPEEKTALQPEPARQEQTHEQQKLTSLPGRTTGRESEAPYWVFNTEPDSENALQPATQSSEVGAETVGSTVKALPTYGKPRNERTFTSGRAGVPDGNRDSSTLLVQLTPRPATPVEVGSGNPVVPAVPVIVPGNQGSDQTPINGSVLENDIAAYRRVTEINPRNDRAWDALGNMYEAASLHSDAIAAFGQAVALAPRKEAYHFHLGIALAYQMHFDKAIEALQNSIALNPNFVLAHCALAANYRRIGHEAEAQEHIAIARPSMEYEKEYNRACFESISGKTDEAFALLEKALEKEQVKTAMLRSDPDLDFIRKDARFEALLFKYMKINQ